MNWLTRLVTARPELDSLDASLRDALVHWQALAQPDLNRPHFDTRYVVVNTEASTADAGKADLLAVAAITLEGGTLAVTDSYHSLLMPEPVAALTRLLTFSAQGPIVVYNAALNRVILEHAFDRHLGLDPEWAWLDLYWLLPALFDERLNKPTRLADWMQVFGIQTFQRQHALGDAYAIALLMLAVEARALKRGLVSARSLIELERSRRHLSGR